MASALQVVQEFFPDVRSVVDADEPSIVEVTKRDSDSAAVRNHKACAMAVACKRKMAADGVIVSVSTAYVVRGKKAVRYHLPERVSREVVSFDRNGGFAPGEYALNVPDKSNRIGHMNGGSKRTNGKGKKVKHHHTTGIRTVLGSKLQ